MFAYGAVGQAVPSRLSSEADGYSFAPPKGWASQASGDGFALVNPAKTVLIAVKAHSYKDFAAFNVDANLQRDGLEPVGKPQEIAGGYTFRTVKRSAQGMTVVDTCVLFSGNGRAGGVIVVAFSDEANANAGFEAGLSVAGSVKFEQPKITAAAEKVRSLLSGKKLTYIFTGNGYSERQDILLCGSGIFYQSTDLGGFTANDVDGPSFAATGGKSGRWSINAGGNKLVLQFAGGAAAEYVLSARQAGNEIGMNGKRFFVQSQNLCR